MNDVDNTRSQIDRPLNMRPRAIAPHWSRVVQRSRRCLCIITKNHRIFLQQQEISCDGKKIEIVGRFCAIICSIANCAIPHRPTTGNSMQQEREEEVRNTTVIRSTSDLQS